MPEPGSQRKRSVSTAISRLSRKRTPPDAMDSDPDELSRVATSSPAPAPLSRTLSQTPSARGHASRASVAGSISTPALPHSSSSVASGAAPSAPASAAGSRVSVLGGAASIEQSVRKFRVVEALRSGDTKAIAKAIRETYDPPASASAPRASISTMAGGPLDDTTVLHLAIQCAELPVVEYVLSSSHIGLDINARDKDGNTPLHVAAMGGRTPVVKLLLDLPDVNDAIPNHQAKLPIDVTRNADIFQLLQLSRSLFTDAKVRQVQELVAAADYKRLEEVLEEPRLKTLLDVNSPEFASDPTTLETGGSLLHEAARKKDARLIQVLLLHGADPFRRDRKGRLPQDVTKDDITRAMLKKSPAAIAAQRGIQEKAVLGVAASQGLVAAASPGDPVAGKESREMKGYLKKWTNYRKGYQLRWFVLENGVLSYYKHQDDAESVCRGVINMRVAHLHMSPDEKTKFEITGKSSVKYTLKANHEVEAKKWYWALNNSIQWTKDQAKEEERQREHSARMLQQAKAEHMSKSVGEAVDSEGGGSVVSDKRNSTQLSRALSNARSARRQSLAPVSAIPSSASQLGAAHPAGLASNASLDYDGDDNERDGSHDDFVDATTDGGASRGVLMPGDPDDPDDDDDAAGGGSGDAGPSRAAATKDALNITAQSARLQLEFVAQVNAALAAEAARNPSLAISDPKVAQALATYEAAARTLKTLIGDLLKISKDRDNYWQYRLNQESQMRRMWEDSMARVALEQEELQARMTETEKKRKATKRALREVMGGGVVAGAGAGEGEVSVEAGGAYGEDADAGQKVVLRPATATSSSQADPPQILVKRATIVDLSDSGSESEEEEFFDAVDAGEVELAELAPPVEEAAADVSATDAEAGADADKDEDRALDVSASFKGYEAGVRTKLKLDADNRPKMGLWGILKSMIGKDMTKMTLPVTFNEPTSLLHRCAEDMEYAELLDLAVGRADSMERMLYVAAFAASEYASTIGRVAKPFNPLLGETFEYARPDKGYRFFNEQVSHHPPIGAAWAEAPHWTYWGESHVKSKFSGKSFDINPLGTWFLRLRPRDGSPEELYTWKKVTSTVVGIITGSPSIDNYGPMEVRNWTTGEVCALDFKARGWKASSAYQLGGKAMDAQGNTRYSIGGRWNSRIYARRTPGFEAAIDDDTTTSAAGGGQRTIDDSSSDKVFLLWQANPRPSDIPFNLTPFVVTFNHIDDSLRRLIAPTDSRLRPDQRAMEEGAYDFAADEKERLEQAQRARRRRREQAGEEFVPAWFEKARCDISDEEYWRFSGKYWRVRERADAEGPDAWRECGLEPIFEAEGDGAGGETPVPGGARDDDDE
jgi:hypothetical protein